MKTRYLRMSDLVGNPKADPPVPPMIPAAKSTIWAWVKQGLFPHPLKLGPRVTVWSESSVLSYLEKKNEPVKQDSHQ